MGRRKPTPLTLHRKDLERLAKQRCYIIGDPLSPLWTGPIRPMSYTMVAEPEERRVTPNMLMYVPQYASDWSGHPFLLACLNLLIYVPRPAGIQLVDVKPGKRFFFLEQVTVDHEKSMAHALRTGELREVDIQGMLERTQLNAKG